MKIILEAIVGSTLHGVAVSDGLEDLDLMAVGVESPTDFIGFSPKDVKVVRSKPVGVRSESGDTDWVGYGLKKYLGLALKGNPSVLLGLFAPKEFTRVLTQEGEELRALATAIVSRRVCEPFRGYMKQQHERLLGLRAHNVTRPELVEKYGYDTKYAAHIIRIGNAGRRNSAHRKDHATYVPDQRDMVRSIRLGAFSLAEISKLIHEAEQKIPAALSKSPLPENPDTKLVESWMIHTYLNHWKNEAQEA